MRPQIKRILLISIALLVVGAGILAASFFFLYVKGVKVTEAKVNQMREEILRLRQRIRGIEALKERLEQEKIRRLKVKNMIPPRDEGEFDRLLQRLLEYARQTRVELREPRTGSQAQRRGTPRLPPGVESATYEFTAVGDFDRLWTFLRVLENSPRFLRIENLRFKRKEGEATTELTLSVTGFAAEVKSTARKPPGAPQPKDGEPVSGKTDLPPY